MSDTQSPDSGQGLSAEADAESGRARRQPMPPWVWALVGAAAAVLVLAVIAAAVLLPGYRGSTPGTTGEPTTTVIATVTPDVTQVAEADEATVAPPVTAAEDPGSSGGSSGSSGGSNGGSNGSSGGGSTSTDSTAKVPQLKVVPKIPLQVLAWRKTYPADTNDWFYGSGQQWSQPFQLPAGKARVVFIIDTGGATQAKVGLVSLDGQPAKSWTVPGMTLGHTFVFESTTSAAGKWLAVAEPVGGNFTWRLRVDRWGTP